MTNIAIINIGTAGERQTGVTSLGCAMVNGFHAQGLTVPLFIAINQQMSKFMVQHRGLDPQCVTWPRQIMKDPPQRVASLVVIDDCDRYNKKDLGQMLFSIRDCMSVFYCPCQIVLLRNPYNLKDLLPS